MEVNHTRWVERHSKLPKTTNERCKPIGIGELEPPRPDGVRAIAKLLRERSADGFDDRGRDAVLTLNESNLAFELVL